MTGAVWISLYFTANLALTIHNKWVLSTIRFAFPWALTALHIGVSGVGALMALMFVYRIRPAAVTGGQWGRLLGFSVLYAVNIAVSNVSLKHVSLAFHQIVRSATPAFTVALEALFLQKWPSLGIACSLIPVMVGICMATADEFGRTDFTLDGFWLTLLGVILSAAKGIVTNQLLVGELKLHPLDLLWKMSFSSVLQCAIYGAVFGEWQSLQQYEPPTRNYWVSLAGNGALAFALNWVSFTANQKTGALSMTVAGNVKQALSILLAVWVFATPVNWLNALGIAVTVAGGAWYSLLVYLEREEKRRKKFTDDLFEYDPINGPEDVFRDGEPCKN